MCFLLEFKQHISIIDLCIMYISICLLNLFNKKKEQVSLLRKDLLQAIISQAAHPFPHGWTTI